MIRKIVFFFICFFSVSSFAATLSCAQAEDTNKPGFCSSFKSVAKCHCTDSGMPSSMCSDMKQIYKVMLDTFGTVERACALQPHTTKQICVDDWNCYRLGGKDSKGRLCSGTGKECEKF